MSYLVLARKWRPKTFDEVVGQATVTRTLKNAIASGRVGHAFLLSGARGVGKTTTARILARALNCSRGEGPTPDPCGECSSCLEIAGGTSMDVQEIDGATNNSVDQVRELRESARYNPARDRFKIWIIDEVHMLSTGAFNALLKTLEEPPPRVKFIFATTEYHKLPDTILSRCQQYDFRLIPAREIVLHLRAVAQGEGVTVSDEALQRIARAAEGSARDALSLLDQVLSFSGEAVRDEDLQALLGLIDRELLLSASQAVAGCDAIGLLELVERLSDYGADYRNFARELLLHFRELLLLKLATPESPLLAGLVPEERERLKPIAAAFSEEDLLRVLDLLTKLDAELRLSQDPRVTLELTLLKAAQMRRLLPFAELVARVDRLAAGVPEPDPPPRPPQRAVPAASTAPAPPEDPGSGGVRRPPAPARSSARETPAVVASEPEPVPPASGDDDLLGRLSALAQKTSAVLQMPLRGALARLEGGVLALTLQPEFVALATGHLEEYQELARKLVGRPLKVRIAAATAAAAPAEAQAPAPAEARRQQLLDEAAGDPGVRETLDLFGGKVVTVREE